MAELAEEDVWSDASKLVAFVVEHTGCRRYHACHSLAECKNDALQAVKEVLHASTYGA